MRPISKDIILMSEKTPLHEVVYTPGSQLVRPGLLIKSMWDDLCASRELAWRLFVRNISAQYRQTMLGYFWAFMPPIATTLTFVFLKSSQILNFGDTEIPYPVYVMIGTLLWQVFLDALNSPIKIISASKSMLTKINFPREALILAGMGEVIFNFLIRLIIFAAVILWFKTPLYPTVFFAPIGIIALMLLGLMFGILLAPIAILFEDIQRGMITILSLWFFLTPVVYAVPQTGPAALLATYNPVSPLLITARDWILIGTTGSLMPFVIVSSGVFILSVIGWILYRLAMPHIIARIGS